MKLVWGREARVQVFSDKTPFGRRRRRVDDNIKMDIYNINIIILKWIFMNWNGIWNGLIWLRLGSGNGLL
jgi:hypothetical protein